MKRLARWLTHGNLDEKMGLNQDNHGGQVYGRYSGNKQKGLGGTDVEDGRRVVIEKETQVSGFRDGWLSLKDYSKATLNYFLITKFTDCLKRFNPLLPGTSSPAGRRAGSERADVDK